MIVSCGNCGKRFKGAPGPRKFKCSGCGNLFTFPETAMAPAQEHVLCSNCWSEMKANPDLKACPMCSQKLSSSYGGRAVEELAPPPQPEPQVDQQQQQDQMPRTGHTGLLDRLAQEEQEQQQQREHQEQEQQQEQETGLLDQLAQQEQQDVTTDQQEQGAPDQQEQMLVEQQSQPDQEQMIVDPQDQPDQQQVILEQPDQPGEQQVILDQEEPSGEQQETSDLQQGDLEQPDQQEVVLEQQEQPDQEQVVPEQQEPLGEQQDVLEQQEQPDQQQVVLNEQDQSTTEQEEASQEEQPVDQQEDQEAIQPPAGEGDASEGDEWRARAEKAEAEAKELEEQINAFREAAISALEPLVPEVDRLMHSLSDEVAQIQTLVSQARQHLQVTAPPPERLMGLSELQKLESSATELQGRVEAVRTALTSRLQEVLGEPEDAPAEEEQLVGGD